jgi:hypothetical protein
MFPIRESRGKVFDPTEGSQLNVLLTGSHLFEQYLIVPTSACSGCAVSFILQVEKRSLTGQQQDGGAARHFFFTIPVQL